MTLAQLEPEAGDVLFDLQYIIFINSTLSQFLFGLMNVSAD